MKKVPLLVAVMLAASCATPGVLGSSNGASTAASQTPSSIKPSQLSTAPLIQSSAPGQSTLPTAQPTVSSPSTVPTSLSTLMTPTTVGTSGGFSKVEGGCMAEHQIGPTLAEEAAQGVSTVVGNVAVTGRTVLARSDASGGSGNVLTELAITVDKTLAGPVPGEVVTAYVYGGKYQNFETDASTALQSAWASDGSVFAQLTPNVDGINKGAYELSALPLIGGTVGFVGVGCETPTGYKSQSLLAQVKFLRNGKVVSEQVTFPAVQLADIETSMVTTKIPVGVASTNSEPSSAAVTR